MSGHEWAFLTNHGHVLVCLARDPDLRVRDIADAVGITQRAVQGIIGDLVAAGYVDKERAGRRNHYELHTELPLRHPLERDHLVGELLRAVTDRVPSAPPEDADDRVDGLG